MGREGKKGEERTIHSHTDSSTHSSIQPSTHLCILTHTMECYHVYFHYYPTTTHTHTHTHTHIHLRPLFEPSPHPIPFQSFHPNFTTSFTTHTHLTVTNAHPISFTHINPTYAHTLRPLSPLHYAALSPIFHQHKRQRHDRERHREVYSQQLAKKINDRDKKENAV